MQMGMGELGWTPQTFWSSTLPELLQAYQGHQLKTKEQYWHTGHLIAALRNVNGGDKGKAVYATQVFPFLLRPGERQPDEDEVWSVEAYTEDEEEVDE